MKKSLSLRNMNGGAVHDIFDAEIEKILANIADLSVKPDAMRELTIHIKIKPDKTRRSASIEAQVTTKLPPMPASIGALYLERENGDLVAYPDDPRQAELDLDESSNIVSMKSRA